MSQNFAAKVMTFVMSHSVCDILGLILRFEYTSFEMTAISVILKRIFDNLKTFQSVEKCLKSLRPPESDLG